MIVALIGTRAQLIKMAPVLLALERAGTPFRLVLTGQHRATMHELLAEFGVAARPEALYEGPEVTGIGQMAGWFLRGLWRALVSRRALLPARSAGRRHAMVVHGDTFSTLLGAVIGRVRGYDVVHVEAGLTSGRLWEPFPEELTRRLVFRLADVGFCPGAWATANLARFRARAVDTGANTLVDALGTALARPMPSPLERPEGGYAVVSLHRFENVFTRARFAFIVEQLERIAERIELVFVLHPATRAQAVKFGLLARLEDNPAIRLCPRMTYVPFMRLLADSRFVITDGGSNQEELSYLGKPTLIMRGATERREGLDAGAVLSRYDPAVIEAFVTDALDREPGIGAPEPRQSPSAIIAAELAHCYG